MIQGNFFEVLYQRKKGKGSVELWNGSFVWQSDMSVDFCRVGIWLEKLHHIDIRKSGSGNAGSTNALRVMGWKAGLMTFAGDVLKCFAAVLIVRGLYHGSNCLALLMMYAGAGVTLGHNFPFYMKFKGGKGIAVMAALAVSNCFWHLPYSALMFFITLAFLLFL